MFDRKILLATDLTDQSRAAEEAAITLAGRLGMPLVILHVVWERSSFGMSSIPPEVSRPEDLGERLQAVGASEAPDATRLLVSGSPAETIVDVAEKESVEIIVVGTQGRSGLARAVLGSVAEAVARQARCCVMLVRPPSGPSRD